MINVRHKIKEHLLNNMINISIANGYNSDLPSEFLFFGIPKDANDLNVGMDSDKIAVMFYFPQEKNSDSDYNTDVIFDSALSVKFLIRFDSMTPYDTYEHILQDMYNYFYGGNTGIDVSKTCKLRYNVREIQAYLIAGDTQFINEADGKSLIEMDMIINYLSVYK